MMMTMMMIMMMMVMMTVVDVLKFFDAFYDSNSFRIRKSVYAPLNLGRHSNERSP